MGWVWSDDGGDGDGDDGQIISSCNTSSGSGSDSERCSTKRIVRSQCRTEQVESGKFIRKCEKTEELIRICVGRPVEVLQSNNEYTEEDVTDEVVKGGSVTFGSSSRSSDGHVFDFPGLRSDIEVMERSLFGGLSRFFDAAEEMKNGFFDVFGNVLDAESPSSSSMRRGIPIEEYNRQEASPKPQEKEPVDTDFAALAKDV
ncbi:fra a 1-associated protein [Lotus japonicus]|uniref:fra a 1-associated protein n=1 Tax=Lotus japonicus TaxID=34305 RepID=UPI00258EC885|nr:fra a 1-associated protein [Lotus japonicus]